MVTVVEVKVKNATIYFSGSPRTELDKHINKQLYCNRREAVVEVYTKDFNDAEGRFDRKGDQ